MGNVYYIVSDKNGEMYQRSLSTVDVHWWMFSTGQIYQYISAW